MLLNLRKYRVSRLIPLGNYCFNPSWHGELIEGGELFEGGELIEKIRYLYCLSSSKPSSIVELGTRSGTGMDTMHFMLIFGLTCV